MNVSDSGELLYSAVRFAFAAGLLLFLLVLLRAMVREIDIGTRDRVEIGDVAPNSAWLYVVDGGSSQLELGQSLAVTKRAVIGRSGDCDIVADDPSVSTVHAAVFSDRERWFVEDFNSTNGTFVSGKPVFPVSAVANGEMIQFGRVRMRLMC